MNYFIIFKNGEKELVPEIIGNAILEAKTPKIIWKNKNGRRMIDLATIGQILTTTEYYQKHPEERPPQEYPKLPEIKKYNKVGSLRALIELRKGLEKFINENPEAKKAIILHKKMNFKIEQIKKMPELKTTFNNLINL